MADEYQPGMMPQGPMAGPPRSDPMAGPPVMDEMGATVSPASQLGFLMVRNNDQIEEAARAAQQLNEKKIQGPQIDALASYILGCWEEAKKNKENNIEPKLMDSWRRRKGEYSPEKTNAIVNSGQNPIFMRLTEVKCNAFEAWFNDIVTASVDKLWSLEPTPLPDMPADVGNAIVNKVLQVVMARVAGTGQEVPVEEVYKMAQGMRDDVLQEYTLESKERSRRMEQLMDDILTEGGWKKAQDDALEHMSTFGTCIVKGPIIRQKQKLAWTDAGPMVQPEYTIQYEAVHPLNVYPAPTSEQPDDGYFIEFIEMRRIDIKALMSHPGYNKKQIEELLMDQYTGQLRKYRDLDISRLNLSDNSEAYVQNYSDRMQGIEYHGLISGRLLKEWGVKGVNDETDDYEVECVMFGTHVIRAVINDNPLGRKKYSKSCFKPRSGSFWGQSIAELMSDVQDICNGAARALVSNMGIASGPIVVIDDIARIPEGVDLTSIHPWMIMQFNGDRAANKRPVEFYSANSHAQELMTIYDRFMRDSDDRTGIPAYSYGSDRVAGAGRTASGLSMLMTSAARGIKKAITDFDAGVIRSCLERLYQHLMLYHPDPMIKGDAQIVAKGALGIFAKEQKDAQLQQIMVETMQSPVDLQIIGEIGRAELLRRRFKSVDKDLERIIPTNEELIQRAEMAAQAQAQAQSAQVGMENQNMQADRQVELEKANMKSGGQAQQ